MTDIWFDLMYNISDEFCRRQLCKQRILTAVIYVASPWVIFATTDASMTSPTAVPVPWHSKTGVSWIASIPAT